MNKITIVVPTYNSANFIDRFMLALCNQTFTDFKVIFVEDASTDNSLEVFSKSLSKYQNIHFTVLQKPEKNGVGKARDFALDSGLIDTEFVIFLDIDDLPHPDFLEKLFVLAETNNTDMAICGYQRMASSDNHVISTEMVHNPDLINDPLDSMVMPLINTAVWNKLIRCSIIKGARFIYPGGGEDSLFLSKIYPNCRKISFVNEVLYDYFVNSSSVSSLTNVQNLEITKNGYIDTLAFYKANHFEKWVPFLEALGVVRMGIGETTRVCIGFPKQKRRIIREMKRFFNANFPTWRSNKYLSLKVSLKHGLKGLMVWRCRFLYKINMFGLFVFEYKTFTRLFKKDIKW